MVRVKRTSSKNKDFKDLILELDKELAARYKEGHYKFYLNTDVSHVDTAVVAYIQDIAVGCGCFKEINEDTVEIKRMFVNPYFRGFGVASAIITELLNWARQLFYKNAVLETGKKQPEAIKLYLSYGFTVIENFGPYIGMEESICMRKQL